MFALKTGIFLGIFTMIPFFFSLGTNSQDLQTIESSSSTKTAKATKKVPKIQWSYPA